MKKYLAVLGGVLLAVVLLVVLGKNKSNSPEQQMVIGDASVDSISVELLETFPIQVQVLARGNFPDGCTTLDTIDQNVMGTVYTATIKTKRPSGIVCTDELVPFTETFLLNGTAGVPAGEYIVRVNGVEKTFTFDIDNFLTDFDPQK